MTQAPLTIRPGVTSDATALAAVQRAAALAAFGSIFPPEAPKPTLEALEEGWAGLLAGPAARVLVAAAPEVIGGAAVCPSEDGWQLARCYVHPDHWGRGIGAGLHDAVLGAAAARGAARLGLTVLEANTPARRMYERRGWRLVSGGRHWPHGPDGPPEVRYAREIGARWR